MNTRLLGFGLIGFGLVLLLLNVYNLQADLTLLLIGSAFLFAYFGQFLGPRKNVGFLIPGCILTALGTWELLSSVLVWRAYEDLGFFAAIGSAFLAIYLIGKANGHKTFWALIVSAAVYCFAGFVYVVSYSAFFRDNEDLIFPMVLILVGTVVVLGSVASKIRKR